MEKPFFDDSSWLAWVILLTFWRPGERAFGKLEYWRIFQLSFFARPVTPISESPMRRFFILPEQARKGFLLSHLLRLYSLVARPPKSRRSKRRNSSTTKPALPTLNATRQSIATRSREHREGLAGRGSGPNLAIFPNAVAGFATGKSLKGPLVRPMVTVVNAQESSPRRR